MRKAEKVRRGIERQAQNLKDSIASGLSAQDRARRHEEWRKQKIAEAKKRKAEKELGEAVVTMTANIKEFGETAEKAAAGIKEFAKGISKDEENRAIVHHRFFPSDYEHLSETAEPYNKIEEN